MDNNEVEVRLSALEVKVSNMETDIKHSLSNMETDIKRSLSNMETDIKCVAEVVEWLNEYHRIHMTPRPTHAE